MLVAAESFHDPAIYFGVITGTHSAGKSTIIDEINDPDLTARHYVAHEKLYPMHPRIGVGMVDTVIDGRESSIPVVTCEEAATRHAIMQGNLALMAEEWTFEHQIRVEFLAQEIAMTALQVAQSIIEDMRPSDTTRPAAIILSDRFATDGEVYSQLRAPEHDDPMIDLGPIDDIRPLGILGLCRGRRYPIRQMHQSFLRNHCDIVFMANHKDVPFEASAKRLPDVDFREQVADKMRTAYADIVGIDRVVDIGGTVEERITDIGLACGRLLDLDRPDANITSPENAHKAV